MPHTRITCKWLWPALRLLNLRACVLRCHTICSQMYDSLFMLLLADENTKDKAGRQIIHHAVMGGSVFLVHYLFIVNEQDLDVS